MALQISGAISIADIAKELGVSPNGLDLNNEKCRKLAGKTSGAIALSDFYGKSSRLGADITIGYYQIRDRHEMWGYLLPYINGAPFGKMGAGAEMAPFLVNSRMTGCYVEATDRGISTHIILAGKITDWPKTLPITISIYHPSIDGGSATFTGIGTPYMVSAGFTGFYFESDLYDVISDKVGTTVQLKVTVG